MNGRRQMNLEILTALMALKDSWKQFFSAVTSVTSALERFSNEMRNINLRFTYLFIYLFQNSKQYKQYKIPASLLSSRN